MPVFGHPVFAISVSNKSVSVGSGFNVDIILESGEDFSTQDGFNVTGTSNKRTFVTTNYVSSKGLSTTNGTVGFPANKSVTVNGKTFEINSYTAKNALRLAYGNSGELTLSTPDSYKKLYFLTVAGGVNSDTNGDMKTTVYYSDGTSAASSFTVYDSHRSDSMAATEAINIGRMSNNTTNPVEKGYASCCAMEVDPSKVIKKIVFSNTSSNTSLIVDIMAISGDMLDIGVPNVSISSSAADSFTLSWNAISGANGYRLDVATDPNFNSVISNYNNKALTANSCVVSGLSSCSTYYCRVRATANDGSVLCQGKSSATVTATTTKASRSGNIVLNPSYVYGNTPNAPSLDKAQDSEAVVTYFYYPKDKPNEAKAWVASNPPIINVGSYYAYAKIAESTHYLEYVSAPFGFEVTKAESNYTVVPQDTSPKYNGQEQVLITAGGTNDGRVLYSLNGTDYAEALPVAKNSNTYTVFYKIEGDSNHNDSASSSLIAHVLKGDRSADLSMQNYTYAQTDILPQPTISYSSDLDKSEVQSVTYRYYKEIADARQWGNDVQSTDLNAGEYTMEAVIGETDNFNSKTLTTTFNVNKADSIITKDPEKNINLVYTGENQELIVPQTAEAIGGAVKYSLDNTLFKTDIPTGKDADTYTVYYKVEESENYKQSEVKHFDIVIGQTDWTDYTVPQANSLTYNGEDQELVAGGSVTGGKMLYRVGESGDYAEAIPKQKNAATYKVYYKIPADNNHREYECTTPVEVTVGKADCVVSSPLPKTLKYTGEELELVEAGTAEGGKIWYKLDDGEYSLDLPKATETGNYIVYFKVVGDANHNDIGEDELPVTIGKAARGEIKVTMNGYVYAQSEDVPSPKCTPDDLKEKPDVLFYYNTSESNVGGTLWKSSEIDSTTFDVGTYYMYAVVETTKSYQEYITDPVAFDVAEGVYEITKNPTAAYTYGEHISEQLPADGIASVAGSFSWVTEDADKMPAVSDSLKTEYGVEFAPDNKNYPTKRIKVTVTVSPKENEANTPAIVIGQDDKVTETLNDDYGTELEEGTDYEKIVVTKATDDGTEYTITYNYKNNYCGSFTKKITVPKADPKKEKGKNPDDYIVTRIDKDDEIISDFAPKLEALSYEEAKTVIAGEIKNNPTQPEDIEIAEKLESGEKDYYCIANLCIRMEEPPEEEIRDQDKILIEKKAQEIPGVGDNIQYMDISMYVSYTIIDSDTGTKVLSTEEKRITDTGDIYEVITINVPSELRVVPPDKIRTYHVVRAHEGDDFAEKLISTTATTIQFRSNKYSTYALLYSDSKKPESGGDEPDNNQNQSPVQIAPANVPIVIVPGYTSPKTGDSHELPILAGMLFIGLTVIIMSTRTRKNRERS